MFTLNVIHSKILKSKSSPSIFKTHNVFQIQMFFIIYIQIKSFFFGRAICVYTVYVLSWPLLISRFPYMMYGGLLTGQYMFYEGVQ